MFPVTGGSFIHTCMHVHIVFAGVRVCVRAGRRVCVSSRYTPTAAEYLPASQPWHVAAPAVLESFPASQLEQVATEVAPTAVENLPASQLVQTVEPAIYVHTLSHTTKGGAR